MSIYNPLSWQNENALASYPFLTNQEIDNFIVDARFIQFDGFVPTLNYVVIDSDMLQLSITTDSGADDTFTYLKTTYLQGAQYRSLRIYNKNKTRYLGVLVFGDGILELWNNHVGRKKYFSASFDPQTVISVPSMDAVYTFDGNYGDVQLGRTSSDKSIFYNCSIALNSITLNAVTGHAVPDGAKKQGLRKINLVSPLKNNINLAANDVIKLTSLNAASLTIDLVSGSSSQSFVVPTLIA